MMYRCLVVDDEPLARRVMEKHIAEVPSLELVGTANNATEAAAFMLANPVDVLFLDIQMPGLSGLDLLKTISHPPQVILTTAYSKYALEGYEHAVVDYLLKPIAFVRFLKAVNKLQPLNIDTKKEITKLALQVNRGTECFNVDDILVVEAFGNYVKVQTSQGNVLASETMKNIEAALPESRFLRVHRSFIVALHAVNRLESSQLWVGKRAIPVGRSYRRILDARFPTA